MFNKTTKRIEGKKWTRAKDQNNPQGEQETITNPLSATEQIWNYIAELLEAIRDK